MIALTLACATATLWTRRLTWSCPWEVAPTLGIARIASGGPDVTARDHGHRAAAAHGHREWHSYDYLGHICYIWAAGAIVYAALSRLVDDDDILRASIRRLELPVLLVVTAMLVALAMSHTNSGYHPDMYDVPVDTWLAVYWLLINGMLMSLFTYAARQLLILRQDERSRLTADMFILGSVYGFSDASLASPTRSCRSWTRWVLTRSCGFLAAPPGCRSWAARSTRGAPRCARSASCSAACARPGASCGGTTGLRQLLH